jgi:hypothetical protein
MLRASAALFGLALLALAPSALAPPALAQSTPATVYCANERILVERTTMQALQSRMGHARICIIRPSFDFQPDGVTWVRQNLRSEPGGACRCG